MNYCDGPDEMEQFTPQDIEDGYISKPATARQDYEGSN